MKQTKSGDPGNTPPTAPTNRPPLFPREASFVTDDFGCVRSADAAALDLVGTPPEAVVGRSLSALVAPMHLGRFRRALRCLRREGAVEVDLVLIGARAQGASVTLVAARSRDTNELHWNLRAVPTRSGPRPTPRDEPIRPDDEAELLADALRRCDELLSVQQARDLALAVLAHELRGPTAAILGWARILRDPRCDPARRERALAVIEDNALQQRTLIEDLMESVRLTAHKATRPMVSLEFGEVVARAVESAQPRAAEKKLTLGCQVVGEVWVEGDARRLSQVVTNLVTNAIKFTPPDGRVAVRVSIVGGAAVLRVADTGLGIARLDLPHIFERFHQGGVGAQAADGVGLGLFLVREIATLHGGTATAESPGPCLGATFTVTLPLAR